MKFIDTNLVLRLLLGDVPKQRSLVLKVLRGGEHHVADLAIAETVFALQRHYKLERQDVRVALSTLSQVDNLSFNQQLVFAALEDFVAFPALSFEDCFLAAVAALEGASLLTFDKKLAKQLDSVELLK